MLNRDTSGKNNPNYGNKWSEEQKKAASELKKLMWKDINSVYNNKQYRKKRSVAISGEKNGMYGKHHSEETKKKIGSANKNKLSGSKNPRARKIELISPDNEKFYTNGNLSEFCKENNLVPSAISMLCKGRRKTHKGWKASYKDNK